LYLKQHIGALDLDMSRLSSINMKWQTKINDIVYAKTIFFVKTVAMLNSILFDEILLQNN
jgi:hypothetical protein